jgi:hypothetical protein
MMIAAIALSGVNFNKAMTRTQIENQAKTYGMEYPSDFKVIPSKEESK